jgi:hypothetical protein
MGLTVDRFEAGDCITSTYGTLIGHLGGRPEIFGAQWGYRRGTVPDAQWPFERLDASRRSPCELIADWYGASVAWTRHVDWPAAWAHVRGLLDAGRPVIVVADSFDLPYCWQFGKEHSPHRIVLTGCTDAGVEVSDGYRGSLYRGPLDLDDLVRAVTSEGLIRPRRLNVDGRNTTITVAGPLRGLASTRERTREVILRNVADYLPGEPGGAESGHELLLWCAAAIRDESAELADVPAASIFEVSAWFGGMASQRSLNARFLRWSAQELDLRGLEVCAEQALALSRSWEKVRNYLFLRLGPLARDGAIQGKAAICRVAELVEAAAQQEIAWCRAVGAEIAVQYEVNAPRGAPG